VIPRAATVLWAAAALALPATASADTQNVGIQTSAFGPNQLSVLAGDTVEWNNQSLRSHTVTARDGSFASPQIGIGHSFTTTFTNGGAFAYYCQVHPFMTGEVDVYPVLVQGPVNAVSPGSPIELSGRAEAGTSTVDIQADTGSGFTHVASAAVDGTGAFHTSVTALASAQYRAMVPAGGSPAVQVLVMDRSLALQARPSRNRTALLRVVATPADPGAIVLLEVQLRERFGWWPTSRRRLDARSGAVFRVRAGARVRVMLTLDDGWTPVVTSDAMRLPRARRSSR
jgi:plastocyanin